MQQHRNDENGAAAGVVGLVGALAFFAFMAVFALFCFASLVFTAVAIAAWNSPVEVFGETMTPEDARGYINRGVMGACLMVWFLAYLEFFHGVKLVPGAWPYLVMGGYAAGSLGIGMMIARQRMEAEAAAPPTIVKTATPPALSGPAETPKRAFEFATWDDEEEMRGR